MPSNKAADWDSAKSDYKDLTNAKKPRVKLLKFFTTSHTGISSALAACDKAAGATGSGAAKKLKEATAKLKQAADSYAKTLDGVIQGEKDANGGEKTDMAKALKALKLRLTSYAAHFENEAAQMEAIEAKGNQLDVAKATAMTNFKQTMAGALAGVAAVKAKPTPPVWDKMIGDGSTGAARRLTTALQQFQVADKTEQTSKPHIAALTPYASGNLMKMPADATPTVVLKRLGDFYTLVKAAKAAYNV